MATRKNRSTKRSSSKKSASRKTAPTRTDREVRITSGIVGYARFGDQRLRVTADGVVKDKNKNEKVKGTINSTGEKVTLDRTAFHPLPDAYQPARVD